MDRIELSNITRHLGQPAYETDGVAIYQVDCVDALRSLPPDCIDLTVTSPPYNIGKEYESRLSVDEYLQWCKEWLVGIQRACTSRGAFWLNLGYCEVFERGRAVPLPYLFWNIAPMYLLQEVVWNYGAGVACKSIFSPRNEKFLWYVNNPDEYKFNLDDVRDPDVKYPNQKKNGKLKCNPLGKNPTDVWNFPKVTSGTDRSSKERTGHPAQFPEAVIERIILACTDPGDLVLDPFSGSGTTAAVARRLGRNAIGFEIRSDYLEIAARRIDSDRELEAITISQSELFATG